MSSTNGNMSTKVVIRYLPPTMTLEEIQVVLEDAGFQFNKDYTVLYYVQGNLFSLPYSRCYLRFLSSLKMNECISKMDRTTIGNSPNKINVSMAPYQKWEYITQTRGINTITQDSDYLAFLEREKEKYENPEEDISDRVFKPITLSDNEEDTTQSKEQLRFIEQIQNELKSALRKDSHKKRSHKKKNKKSNDQPASKPTDQPAPKPTRKSKSKPKSKSKSKPKSKAMQQEDALPKLVNPNTIVLVNPNAGKDKGPKEPTSNRHMNGNEGPIQLVNPLKGNSKPRRQRGNMNKEPIKLVGVPPMTFNNKMNSDH